VVIKGVDLASYQGAPDFARVRAAGYEFGITKVTEGLSYTFPGFRRNRTEMARAGMAVGFYHFARGGDPGKEANYFLAAIGKLEPGEVLALDWEISNVQNPVEWCRAMARGSVPADRGTAPRLPQHEHREADTIGVR
jgi:GH25 family lysozyme M1 (1,4-beta-N-acetylmuramidase)